MNRRGIIRKFSGKWILYSFYLLIITYLLSELVLRIYNPFSFRQKGATIVLPRNRKMIISNDKNPDLEKQIIHTKNSLGFRGPEMPKNFDDCLSIIAVGGSTTECFFLNDHNCWTALLSERLSQNYQKIWVNNAGYQGHSTFGHFILINDYIKYLHPKYVLLLVGCNEVNRTDIAEDESVAGTGSANSTWGWLKGNSEVIALVLNLQRKWLADRLHVTDGFIDLRSPANQFIELSESRIDSVLNAQQPLVRAYRKRLERILDTCLQNNIRPVLMTQPSLFGIGKDPLTRCNLETFKVGSGYNGLLMWKLLEQYNDITRTVAMQKHLLLIDLAHEIAKNSLYFYDAIHFTDQGSERVADTIALHLDSLLQKDHPGFMRK